MSYYLLWGNSTDGSISFTPPFTPASIPNLALWLDASDTSTITTTGSSVTQWDDKSGNGHHATQNVGANQPQTGVRMVNGLNALDFDGTNSQMILPSTLYDTPTDDSTLLILAATDATVDGGSSGYRLLRGTVGGGTRYGLLVNRSTSGRIEAVNNTSFITDEHNITVTTAPTIWGLKREGGSVESIYDGALTGSIAAAVNVTLQSLVVGSVWRGAIAEVILYRRALTVSEMTQLIQYYTSKWGV